MLSQAQYFAASLDFERSVGLYRQVSYPPSFLLFSLLFVLSSDPLQNQAINEGGLQGNAEVLEDFALVLLEVGEFQEAIDLLQRFVCLFVVCCCLLLVVCCFFICCLLFLCLLFVVCFYSLISPFHQSSSTKDVSLFPPTKDTPST